MTGGGGDLRLAGRRLLRSPGFTAAAALTLALGIGANTAAFTLAGAALLRPLPYPESGRLAGMWETQPAQGKTREKVSAANYLDWRRDSRSFETLVAWTLWGAAVTGAGEPEELTMVRASPGLLEVLGVAPALGRGFLPEEETAGRHRVVLLSHAVWQGRYGGDSAVVGRGITLDGEPFRVIGVMPPGFRFPDEGDVAMWTPLAFDGTELVTRAQRTFQVLGRLAPGADLEGARSEMTLIAGRLADRHRDTNAGWGVTVLSANAAAAEGSRRPLGILLGAAACVLLIACANVGHLFLVRTLHREGELALRMALGAGPGRVARLLVMEGALVALLGGVAGVAMAAWAVPAVRALDPGLLPGWRTPELDGTALLFAAGLLGVVTLACGLLPAVRVLRIPSREAIAGRRLSRGLILGEVAFSVLLLIGAGLLLRSLVQLHRVDPGFQPEQVLAGTVFLNGAEYDDDARQAAFFRQLVGRLGAVPGVTAAGAVTTLPMNPVGIDYDLPFAADGHPPANPAEQPQVDFRVVAGDYFRAVGIPVLRGRGLAPTDREGGQPVVVVNETLAARYFPGTDPLGRRVWVGGGVGQASVVGVVGNVRHRGLTDRPRPEVYVPSDQDPHGGMTVVIRAAGDPAALARILKAQVYALSPNQPVRDIVTLPDLLSRSVAPRRFQLALLGGFAGLALALAAIGVYGVIAYAVGRRRKEIGIRIALGAGGPDIRRTVLAPGLGPAAAGVLAGAAAAWALGGLLQGELYEVSAHDPATYLGAAVTLLLVAWLACEIPARRAARTDPVTALRSE